MHRYATTAKNYLGLGPADPEAVAGSTWTKNLPLLVVIPGPFVPTMFGVRGWRGFGLGIGVSVVFLVAVTAAMSARRSARDDEGGES